MAKLYYYYGVMGSSKTANALMTHFNYEEVGQKALLCKSELDTRDGAGWFIPGSDWSIRAFLWRRFTGCRRRRSVGTTVS